MHERDPDMVNDQTKPEIGYEYRDISLKGIGLSMFWFFGSTTVVIALTYVAFVFAVQLPLRSPEPPKVPGGANPLLQSNVATKVDIAKLRQHEEKQLQTYGWVDKSKGIARIPVDKAIELTAERGLQPTATDTNPQGEVNP